MLQRGVKKYPFTIPLILSVEVGTLICVWLYSEEPNTHSPCGSNYKGVTPLRMVAELVVLWGHQLPQAVNTAALYSGSTTTTSSCSVKGAAGKAQQKGRRNRSAAAVARRTPKGIAKRFEHNLKTEDTKAEQEVPFFGSNPNPARASQYYQAQSETSCSTSGHSTYATFLAPHARLKRPLGATP